MELSDLKDKIISAFQGTDAELQEILALVDDDKSVYPFNEYEHLICHFLDHGSLGQNRFEVMEVFEGDPIYKLIVRDANDTCWPARIEGAMLFVDESSVN